MLPDQSFNALVAYADNANAYAQSALCYAHICELYPQMRPFVNALMRPFKIPQKFMESVGPATAFEKNLSLFVFAFFDPDAFKHLCIGDIKDRLSS